jgi:hypothetical protein
MFRPSFIPSFFFLSSFFWEEPSFWDKALHIQLIVVKIVHERYPKKICEDRATLDLRSATSNAKMIWLVLIFHKVFGGFGPLPSPSLTDPCAKISTCETQGTRRRFMRWLFKYRFNGTLPRLEYMGISTYSGVIMCL